MDIDIKRLKTIRSEKKRLLKYISRSQKAMTKNVKLLKRLEREQELLLTPCLPGLDRGWYDYQYFIPWLI